MTQRREDAEEDAENGKKDKDFGSSLRLPPRLRVFASGFLSPSPTLSELNTLTRTHFTEALGWVFENSPWVAERAWEARPFSSIEQLHHAMAAAVDAASRDEQLALLRAHPDLGTRARVTDASRNEQEGAGLDRLTPEEFERLSRWNAEYRERFGFPFLFAVRGSTKHDILQALEQRRHASLDAEFAEALRQVYRIARYRLETAIS